MIDVVKNKRMNEALSELYFQYSDRYLNAYENIFEDKNLPKRINEFGIIDEERYDTDNGILFIAKETNDWSNEEIEKGYFFRQWLHRVSKEGVAWHYHIKKHPKMWYNLGRWSMYMNNPEVDMLHICECTHEAVLQLGTIAYTNMNKMRGNSSSGAEYWNLATHPLSGEILRAELEILQPRVIVCCGTYDVFKHHFPDYEGIVISMPHPGAFKATMSMLQSLDEQYKKQV